MNPYLSSLPTQGNRQGVALHATSGSNGLFFDSDALEDYEPAMGAEVDVTGHELLDTDQFNNYNNRLLRMAPGASGSVKGGHVMLPLDDLLVTGPMSTPGMASKPFRQLRNNVLASGRAGTGLTPEIGVLGFGSPASSHAHAQNFFTTGMTPGNDGTPLSEIACTYSPGKISPTYSPSIFSFDSSPRPAPTPLVSSITTMYVPGSVPTGNQQSIKTVQTSCPAGHAPTYTRPRSTSTGSAASLYMEHIGDHTTPGMCSPELQKSLIAMGVVRDPSSDLLSPMPPNADSYVAEINEISMIDPVDASGVATDLDNSGTDLDSSILDQVTRSAETISTNKAASRPIVSSPSMSPVLNESFSRTNSSAINITDPADMSTSGSAIHESLSRSTRSTPMASTKAGQSNSRQASGHQAHNSMLRSKRKLMEMQSDETMDKMQSLQQVVKRLPTEELSPVHRETRSRRLR